uniref:Kunitz/BPTI-like toxin transcript variant X5 n=1 Tax=Micrurus mipartitus TaxID=430902 RepID=A0AAU6NSZ1_MICMP
MSSGGLLLLLGLLTLWAELTPVSGQDRPEYCYLPPDSGQCLAINDAYYYNPAANECQQFNYGGCHGNDNNFETKDECHYTCVEKPGVCPKGSPKLPCDRKCENDWKCPGEQKCCHYGCLSMCRNPVYGKQVLPTRRPSRIGSTVRT